MESQIKISISGEVGSILQKILSNYILHFYKICIALINAITLPNCFAEDLQITFNFLMRILGF